MVTVRKRRFFLILAVTGAALITQGCHGKKQTASGRGGVSLDKAHLDQETSIRIRLHRPYSKIKVPAELLIDLVQPERRSGPLGILVSASTAVTANSGMLTLRLPELVGEPSREELLWAGEDAGLIAETQEYALAPLPMGRYHFVAILEFTPDHPNAEKLVISKSLYVDVRADGILSSNVSFRQIERLEIYGKLEERALARPTTKLTDKKRTGPYYMSAGTANAAPVENEMARLKATHPDVARQVMALSSQEAESKADSEEVIRSRTGPPAFERAVPVPREFRH